MVTAPSAHERARRGAAYLDDVAPGWFDGVDVGSLNLADGNACVLGQLHGSFSIGLGRSGLFSLSSAPRASFSPVDLGFHCVQGVSADLQDVDHANLTEAWREEVGRRLTSADHPSSAEDHAVVGAEARYTIVDLPHDKKDTLFSGRGRRRVEAEAEF